MTRAMTLLIGALASAAAQAAPFADPTRPPNVNTEAASGAQGVPRLESVLIAPDRRIAVISGRAVSLGGKVGEARVVRISETEVVLQNGDQRETLKLFPQVEKKGTRTPARRADGTGR